MHTIHIHHLEDWQQVVAAVMPRLTSGTILTLSGPLGAGKTTFTQELVRTLGSKRIPKSPTFALLHQYAVSGHGTDVRRVLHVDAYRIEHEHDLQVLNLDEELAMPGTMVIIEWPENIAGWLQQRTSAVVPMSIKLEGEERAVMLGA